MPTDRINDAIEHVRSVLEPSGGLADGDLLGSFIDQHDEAAFAALVRSHGPMVWGVCRRLLAHHDAEDAFQATFLVLVRKAKSITPRNRVANWLYGVAHQTALQARRTAARRRAREVQVTAVPDAAATQPEQRADLQHLLDQELNRLPVNYRTVIVLCDLEGRTRKEVARQLGVPEGTVAGRLARARAMLATRLTRRGVALSGAALAAPLAQQAACAEVPASVVLSTIQAAAGYAAGRAAVATTTAIALTERVLRAMLMSKVKAVMAVILLAAVSCCLGWQAYQVIAAPGPRPVARAPAPVPAEKPLPKELLPFQGYWKLTLCDSDAEGLGAEQQQVWKWRWTVKGDKIIWGRQGEEWELSLKVDPARQPKEIDLIYLSGPFKGRKCLGMYEWGGTDGKSLNISIQDPGAAVPRPTSIAMKGGGKTALIFLRPTDPVDAKKELTALAGNWTFAVLQTDPNEGWPTPIGKGPDKTGQGSERRWVINGQEVSWTGPDGQAIRASFTIDPYKVPKHIDLTFLSGPNKGEKCQGVYERGGIDGSVLWLCMVDPGQKAPRPKDISYASFQQRSMIKLLPYEDPTKK